MKFMVLAIGTIVTVVAMLGACAQPAGPAPTATPQASPAATKSQPTVDAVAAQWDRIVTEAKKEEVVSTTASWSPETRDNVIRAVKDKYGISVEVSTGGTASLGQKILEERRAGIFNFDATVQGTNFGVNIMKPVDGFDPAEPALILPEVKDPKMWQGGAFPWFDRAHTMIPFFARLDTNLSINTTVVKPGEISAYKDLLDPKWKGKIIVRDPLAVGTGSGWFRENGKDLGMDFMRALVKQDVIFSSNDRQCVEWLARGRGAALIAGSADQLTLFMGEGSPIAIIDAKDSRTFSPSSGIVSLVNRAPHPNAARLFINWILTKEAQTLLSKTEGLPSRRLDVPTDHILPVLMLQPDRKYREYTEDDVAGDAEAQARAKEIFGPYIGK